MNPPDIQSAYIAKTRGRIAAHAGTTRVPPPDILPIDRESWIDGYNAELTCPTIGQELADFPTVLSKRRNDGRLA